ncbi:MAG: TonB-dependent receptor [Muribaculaceae bacterium]|jgi:TonB-linked SusC/RagA family outer membrane protein|nr:TonB-dependent receptor [Muribaculaceae bacterium]MCI9028625.1 TonB-dependent receptor [Muribaculaceae bacterium]
MRKIQFLFRKCIIMNRLFHCAGLLLVFLTAVCFPLSAEARKDMRVTLNETGIPMPKLLELIEKQSGCHFVYNKNITDFNAKVSLKVVDAPLESALNKLFAGRGISYEIDDKYVILKSGGKAQPKKSVPMKVTGIISDKNAEPLIGATIAVKGKKARAVAGLDGDYTIDASKGDVLVFTYIGFSPKEVKVGSDNKIDVVLEESETLLGEVVVVGYGTMKKKDLTGAVSSINGDAVTDRKVSMLSSALQGALSGVQVTRSGSDPSAGADIKIRGITTIGDSNPLIIVDGVPADNINDINPQDVKDITVLKDAASAAIYGSRAAAGVILITTKRASDGKVSLQYSYEYGYEKPTTQPDYVDVTRFMAMTNELRWNDAGNGPDHFPTYIPAVINNYATLHAQNPNGYPDTDWRGLLLKGHSNRQSHNFRISGGTSVIRTTASIGYDMNDGLYADKDYNRFTVRMNNDITINKYIQAAIDVNVKRSTSTNPNYDPMNACYLMPPVYAAMWEDGRIADGKSGDNPYAALNYGGTTKNHYNQVGGKAAVYITPVKGLKLSAIVSPIWNDWSGKHFRKRIEYFSADDPDNLIGAINGYASTYLSESRGKSFSLTKQFLANYDNTFGDHSVSALVGYEDNSFETESIWAARDNFALTEFPYLDRGNDDYQTNGGNASHTAYRSVFGRAMYNYQGRYLLQANIRCDRSSRFDKKYRAGWFPSVSAGWVVTSEPWFRKLELEPWLSFLKVRASYGLLGNDRVGNYPYLPLLNYTNALFWEGNKGVTSITAAQWQYAIRDISWETTKTFGVGLDLAFFDSRLNVTADYYYKITKDMILDIDIPDYIGYDNPQQNTGKMRTTGFEVELRWRDRVADFSYSVAANLSDYTSKMGYLGGNQFLGDQIKTMGSYFNEWYGYRSDGIFQTQEEINNYPVMNSSVRPGDIKYLKADPNDKTPVSPDKDRVFLGNSQPRWQYGLTLNGSWRGFDLSVAFQGVGSQLKRKTATMVQPLRDNFGNIPKLIDGRYWSNYNTPEENLRAEYPRLTSTQSSYNYAMSDFWLFKSHYLRLKNISLGYTLPQSVTKHFFVQALRFYVAANDLFCITNYPRGWDYEGYGSTSYPITKSFICGVNITF